MGEPEVFQSVAEIITNVTRAKNGYRNGGNHDNGWGSVYMRFVACLRKCGCIFVNVVDLITLFGANTVWFFCVGQTDSKYAQNSDSRALATAKRCIWHFLSSFQGCRKFKNQ